MATAYRVRYAILPAGVGPDDYESGDLEKRDEVFELSDPVPAGFEVAGAELHYGPHITEVKAAVAMFAQPPLPQGAEPIVLDWRAVED